MYAGKNTKKDYQIFVHKTSPIDGGVQYIGSRDLALATYFFKFDTGKQYNPGVLEYVNVYVPGTGRR